MFFEKSASPTKTLPLKSKNNNPCRNYMADNKSSVMCINEKSTEGGKILNLLYDLDAVDVDNEYVMSPDADLERAITAEELLVGIKQDLRAKCNSRTL